MRNFRWEVNGTNLTMLEQAEALVKMCYLETRNSGLEVAKGCQTLSTMWTKSCVTQG